MLNKFRLEAKKPLLSNEGLETLIKKLKYLGLIDVSEAGYAIERRSLIKLWGTRPAKLVKKKNAKLLKNGEAVKHLEDKMIIDSDMQMTIYRRQTIPEVFYLALTIGKLSLDEYVITASWDYSRNTFCEAVGLGPGRLSRWLKSLAPFYF